MSVRYTCDRCGQEIPGLVRHGTLEINARGPKAEWPTSKTFDLCETCCRAVTDAICAIKSNSLSHIAHHIVIE